MEEALENPIGTAPLRQIAHPGDRVAIVVNDITRMTRTDLMLPPIVNTLNAAGIRISHLLRDEWTTRGSVLSDAAGRAGFRGFYGLYALVITLPGGRQITHEARFVTSGTTESFRAN